MLTLTKVMKKRKLTALVSRAYTESQKDKQKDKKVIKKQKVILGNTGNPPKAALHERCPCPRRLGSAHFTKFKMDCRACIVVHRVKPWSLC